MVPWCIFSFCSFQFIGPLPKQLASEKSLQGPLWPWSKTFRLKHWLGNGIHNSKNVPFPNFVILTLYQHPIIAGDSMTNFYCIHFTTLTCTPLAVDKMERISQCIHRLLLLWSGITVSVNTPTQQNWGNLISPGIITCVDGSIAAPWEKSGLTCRRPLGICCGGVCWYGVEVGTLVWVNEVGKTGRFEELDWRCRGICWLARPWGISTLSDCT